MQGTMTWTDGMHFVGESSGHSVSLDAKAPVGKDTGMTPKELVALGIAGCTSMDVVGLLKKYKQSFESFQVEADFSQTSSGHPVVFATVDLIFRVKGQVEPEKLLEAVRLSQSKYCGVSAMIHKTAPIRYKVELNGEMVGQGTSEF